MNGKHVTEACRYEVLDVQKRKQCKSEETSQSGDTTGSQAQEVLIKFSLMSDEVLSMLNLTSVFHKYGMQ